MIKNFKKFLFVMTAVFMLLSSVAYAEPTFRLRIENLETGQGIVITDNGTGDLLSQDGGVVFAGMIGNLDISITSGASKPLITSANGYAELDLSSLEIHGGGSGTIRITLVDSGYTNGPDGVLHVNGLVGGTLTAPAGSTVSFQSWVNPDDLVPDLGADSPASSLLAPIGSLPAGSVGAYSSATFGPGAFSTSSSQEFIKSGNYSLFSQATIYFSGAGTASFDLNATVSTPEPASLLLLGSGLASLGLLGKKRKSRQS